MQRQLCLLVLAILLASCAAPRLVQAALASLDVGTCFSGWDPSTAASQPKQIQVSVVDCGQPHESEFIANSPCCGPAPTSLGPNDYPGAAVVEAYSAMACREFLPSYLGQGQDATRLVVSVAIVSENQWRAGDRTNLCIASFPAGPEKESIRDPAR